MAALGEPPQGCGGTAAPFHPDRSLFLTVRTPRQAWLGNNEGTSTDKQGKRTDNRDTIMDNEAKLTNNQGTSTDLKKDREDSYCIMSSYEASWVLTTHHEYSWNIIGTHGTSQVLMMHQETLDALWILMTNHLPHDASWMVNWKIWRCLNH